MNVWHYCWLQQGALSSLVVVVMVQSAGWMIDELKLLQLFRFDLFMRLNLMGLFGSDHFSQVQRFQREKRRLTLLLIGLMAGCLHEICWLCLFYQNTQTHTFIWDCCWSDSGSASAPCPLWESVCVCVYNSPPPLPLWCFIGLRARLIPACYSHSKNTPEISEWLRCHARSPAGEGHPGGQWSCNYT